MTHIIIGGLNIGGLNIGGLNIGDFSIKLLIAKVCFLPIFHLIRYIYNYLAIYGKFIFTEVMDKCIMNSYECVVYLCS